MTLPAIPPEVTGIVLTLLGAVGVYYRKRIRGNASESETETAVRNYLADQIDGLPSPKQTEISEEHLVDTLQDAVPDDAEIITLDGSYYAPTTAGDAKTLLVLGEILDWFPYRPDRFDCENYAQLMATFSALVFGINTVAVVIDWSDAHAYNMIVTADGDALAVEPQSGEIVEIGTEGYEMTRGRIHV